MVSRSGKLGRSNPEEGSPGRRTLADVLNLAGVLAWRDTVMRWRPRSRREGAAPTLRNVEGL